MEWDDEGGRGNTIDSMVMALSWVCNWRKRRRSRWGCWPSRGRSLLAIVLFGTDLVVRFQRGRERRC